jgi:hypothetical protein
MTIIAAAARHITDAEATVARIEAAIAGLPAEAPLADTSTLARRVEDLTAAVALGEATPADLEAARKDLDAAHQARTQRANASDQAAAARAGFERRLAEARKELEEAEAALAAAECDHLYRLIEEADAKYRQAAEAAYVALSRIAAAHGALEARGVRPPLPAAIAQPTFFAAGPISAEVAMQAWPGEPHGFAKAMFRNDPRADREALEAELIEARGAEPAGVVARVRNALRKAAA